MKLSITLTVAILGSVAVALASPVASSPRLPRDDVGGEVAGIGRCTMDCWNEAAVEAGCDPNEDDACLCGAFFDAVIDCTSETCNLSDNLGNTEDFYRHMERDAKIMVV
ncbi:hypothetical protein BKA66DRAFT_136977 [Pyrenochaeta sp. MPI-SDFR-AT-0127]|nr:hypothetical protein BKA66DRAFT_136977 [Pyrenochaeta sp. MPI-SDFR-AT-0127]